MLKSGGGNVVGQALSPANLVRIVNEHNSAQQLMITNYNRHFGNFSPEAIEEEEKDDEGHDLPLRINAQSMLQNEYNKGNLFLGNGFIIGAPQNTNLNFRDTK